MHQHFSPNVNFMAGTEDKMEFNFLAALFYTEKLNETVLLFF